MLSREDLLEAITSKTQWGYAESYVYLDGFDEEHKFSFRNHAYLHEMYLDEHPYIVCEKAAQMGASVLGMIKSFYVCDKLAKNVIYFFPTDEDVREFSKTRVAPIIRDSPHIASIVDEVDSVGIRRIGRGFLYFRGMRSNIRMKSVPADMLVFDELDEVTDTQRTLADQRLNHSDLKWRFLLSTPTFDGFGIDYEFQKSDMRYWNLVCPKCETRNILEKQFPDCVKRIDELTAILVCRSCGGQLDSQHGVWIAEKPDRKRIRGYHLCGLYSYFADLPGILDEYASGRKREEFFRSKLGLPWVATDQRVTRDLIESCMTGGEQGPSMPHCFMGVDQKGDALHVVVRNYDKITRRPTVMLATKVKKFNELSSIMARYDVDLCVIDALPNQHSARDFSEAHAGRVFLCYYNDNQKNDFKWTTPGEGTTGGDYQVVVNRTEALDAMYEELFHRDVVLPKFDEEAMRQEFITNLMGLARVNEIDEDKGITGAIWKKLGEDHFAHAMCYSYIASSRFGSPIKSVVTFGKQGTATVRSFRNYNRSQF
jgi:hypothetical protein